MERLGTKLMEARERLKMSRAEVAAAASKVADRFGNPQCSISESWLRRIEENEGVPSSLKLLTLIHIYHLDAKDLLVTADTSTDPVDSHWRHRVTPETNVLVESEGLADVLAQLLPSEFVEPPEETHTLDNDAAFSSKRYTRAIIGTKENRAYPMLRPGAVVLIDRQRRDINKKVKIGHELETPLFFFLTHDAPICGWARRKENGMVTIWAHPAAQMDPIHLRYEQEAELVGQVVAVQMWLVRETS